MSGEASSQPRSEAFASHGTTYPNSQIDGQPGGTVHAKSSQAILKNGLLVKMPPELWLCVIDHLCPHCQPGSACKPGITFVEQRIFRDKPKILPLNTRSDLLSISRSCRELRDLAQSHLFHVFDREREHAFSSFRDTIESTSRLNLRTAVREMIVSSDPGRRGILQYVSNLRKLTYRIGSRSGRWTYERRDQDVLFGNETLVGKLENLRELVLFPRHGEYCVHVSRGRLWLQALMKAAPEMRSLGLRRFVDSHTYGRRTQLSSTDPANYAGLPQNKITKLDLQESWFPYHSLEQLLSNLPNLRYFRLAGTSYMPWEIPDDMTLRVADSHESKS